MQWEKQPVRRTHTLTVELHPEIAKKDLKTFQNWYKNEMSETKPLPSKIKRILRDASKLTDDQKRKFAADVKKVRK